MKELYTTLTERGQISIPAQIRRDLHLKPGMKIGWEEISDCECRLVIKQEKRGCGARAMLGYAKQFRQTKSTDKWMSELRDGDLDS